MKLKGKFKMEWSDEGIVVSVKKYSENKMLLHILTRKNGLHSGIVSFSNKNAANFQMGNFVHVNWKGRLKEHVGFFNLELQNCIFAKIIHEEKKIAALNVSCALIFHVIPERENAIDIFLAFKNFLLSLTKKTDFWQINYFFFEISLLSELGFGVDFSKCAVTGENSDLFYVSPRSARAVSFEAGKEFHDKLLIMPDFLKTSSTTSATEEDLLKALKISGFFLQKHVFDPLNKQLPKQREEIC